MCVNRLYVKNSKLDFNPLIDRYYNYVPCGVCEECLQAKKNDITVRTETEFDACRAAGGSVFYYTLTYDNMHIPKFEGISCFSKSQCQKFFRSLRDWCGCKFSYILTSEYGHKNLRPHYHCLLMFYDQINPLDLYKFIDSIWIYGTIHPGRALGLVNNVQPAEYVTKYISKDVSSFIEMDKKFSDQKVLEDFRSNKQKLYKNINILPFSLKSVGFGDSLSDSLKFSHFVDGYFFRTDSAGVSRKVMIPLYCIRKKLYDTVKLSTGNVGYRINDFGLAVLRARLLKKYPVLVAEYQTMFKYSLIYFDKIPYLKDSFKTLFAYENFIKQFNTFEHCSFLARYTLLYNGLSNIDFTQDFVKDLEIYVNYVKDHQDYSKADLVSDQKAPPWIGLCLDIIEHTRCYVNYLTYDRNSNNYNTYQRFKSFKTGIYKPTFIKNIVLFKNFKASSLCLTTLTSRGRKLKNQVFEAA